MGCHCLLPSIEYSSLLSIISIGYLRADFKSEIRRVGRKACEEGRMECFCRLRGQCAGLEWGKALIDFKKEKNSIEKREREWHAVILELYTEPHLAVWVLF